MFLKTFRNSFALTAIALVIAYFYGGPAAVATVAVLGILEVSLSFDNAVMNATVLEKMSEGWQRIFLTVGVFIAVIGMRLTFPLLVVSITASMNPVQAFHLAMAGGSVHTPGTYAFSMHAANPAIASFGGMFLLMIFLDFAFDAERELSWLSWAERPLAKVGKLDTISAVVALGVLVASAQTFAKAHATTVLVAGVLGVSGYLLVNALGELFESESDEDEDAAEDGLAGIHGPAREVGAVLVKQAGRAAVMSFLYLEVLDASMSFDGVIGAFAITVDPIVIALGLGLIGAPYVRALTVYLVRKGTLSEYEYLDHGAHWAIGALAVALLVSITHEVPEYVTGLTGVAFIAAAVVSSVVRNRRAAAQEEIVIGESELVTI